MAKRYYALARSYTAREIREFEKLCVIPSPTDLPPLEEWPSIEDMIRDLNTCYKKYCETIGSYIEAER